MPFAERAAELQTMACVPDREYMSGDEVVLLLEKVEHCRGGQFNPRCGKSRRKRQLDGCPGLRLSLVLRRTGCHDELLTSSSGVHRVIFDREAQALPPLSPTLLSPSSPAAWASWW